MVRGDPVVTAAVVGYPRSKVSSQVAHINKSHASYPRAQAVDRGVYMGRPNPNRTSHVKIVKLSHTSLLLSINVKEMEIN